MEYDRFGPYTVHECLGVGGMATVHRATLDIGGGVIREVALKRLLPQLVDDKMFVQDFIREAKLSCQLQHPNIVRILELGRSQGTYFMAMELVVGQSINALMKLARKATHPTPIGVVVALVSELCDALDYASNCTGDGGEPLRIVHRDLSPSNLIITDDGHLKIIDFGVAKALSGKFMTNTGLVKGKLGYMSVEALAGEELDARADLFSVGVVAWELLTGKRLFKGANEYDVITQVREGVMLPPSVSNASCPDELDQVVMRALAREREDRWGSAAEMRRALDAVRRYYRDGAPQVAAWKSALAHLTPRIEVPRPASEDETTAERLATDDLQLDLAEGSVRQPSQSGAYEEMYINSVLRPATEPSGLHRAASVNEFTDEFTDEQTTSDTLSMARPGSMSDEN